MRSTNYVAIPTQVIAAGSVNSAAIHVPNTFAISAQVIAATGGVAGTLKFQASNDSPEDVPTPVNWTDIASQTVAVTGVGTFLIPKFDISYEFVRVVYTASSSGTITVKIKALGA